MSVWLPIRPEPQRLRIKGFLGFPTHIPTSPARLPSEQLVIYRTMCARTNTHTPSLVKADWGELVLSSCARRDREARRHQWSIGGTGELTLHHGDVRDLPPRGTQTRDAVVSQCCHLLTTELKNMPKEEQSLKSSSSLCSCVIYKKILL